MFGFYMRISPVQYTDTMIHRCVYNYIYIRIHIQIFLHACSCTDVGLSKELTFIDCGAKCFEKIPRSMIIVGPAGF